MYQYGLHSDCYRSSDKSKACLSQLASFLTCCLIPIIGRTMQCYTRSDDYFGEVERFIRLQRGARNIDYTQSKTATAQLNTISGDSEKKTWWANDHNFVRTAAVVLRMLMLRATKIHANLDKVWKNKLVSWGSIALTCNKDSIHTDGEGEIPCPADDLIEAGRIAAYYDTQFPAKKMMSTNQGCTHTS